MRMNWVRDENGRAVGQPRELGGRALYEIGAAENLGVVVQTGDGSTFGMGLSATSAARVVNFCRGQGETAPLQSFYSKVFQCVHR